MPNEKIATLVIGGGQAGLVMSHRLKQRGLSHLVLERQRIAERWRSERWEGLQFQFPNWSVRLPDFPFPQNEPDAFATSAEIVAFIEELLWDRAVWHDRSWLFGEPWNAGSAMKLVIVPLLALPQLTHYLLDGFIWQRHESLLSCSVVRPLDIGTNNADG